MKQPIPSVPGVDHKFVDVGDLQFHVAEAGQGEPVVLLHGWPQHWYMWRHQIPCLAENYRVICPDLRGLGWTGAPKEGYKKEQLAADIIGLLDTLGVSRFHLLAHDWGGFVGFLICLQNPGRVKSYLALNAAHPFQSMDSRLMGAWRFWYQFVIAMPWLGHFMVRRSWFVEKLLRLGLSLDSWNREDLEVYSSRLADPDRAKATVLLYRTFLFREFLPIALGKYKEQRLETPTRLLFGRDDFAIGHGWLRGCENYADDFSIEFVENCGHFIAEEMPELVTGHALEFFGGHNGATAT